MNQKENQPLFSIVIPIYNAQKYLEQCLDSIEGQMMVPLTARGVFAKNMKKSIKI